MKKLLLIPLLFLSSCMLLTLSSIDFNSPSYTYLSYLEKGDEYKQVFKDLEEYDCMEYRIKTDGKKFDALVVPVMTSITVKEKKDMFADKHGERTITREETRYLTSYYLLFEDKKLISWGFEYELRRFPDNRYAKHMDKLRDLVNADLEDK